jgi:hypothetical protein
LLPISVAPNKVIRFAPSKQVFTALNSAKFKMIGGVLFLLECAPAKPTVLRSRWSTFYNTALPFFCCAAVVFVFFAQVMVSAVFF